MVSPDDLMKLLAVDSKIFFHENFHTHDHITEAPTGSGEISITPRSMLLQTQLIANSTCRTNYVSELYNPRYSRTLIRLRLNSMEDVFAYWGLKTTIADPTWQMTVSNAGFMLYDGKLYAVTGDSGTPSANYRTVQIGDIDATRDLLYEIRDYDFRWYSIPLLEPYLDELIEPELEKIRFRKWSNKYSCATVQPLNQVHYLMFFIKNLTNANKYLEVKSVTYHEEYSD